MPLRSFLCHNQPTAIVTSPVLLKKAKTVSKSKLAQKNRKQNEFKLDLPQELWESRHRLLPDWLAGRQELTGEQALALQDFLAKQK